MYSMCVCMYVCTVCMYSMHVCMHVCMCVCNPAIPLVAFTVMRLVSAGTGKVTCPTRQLAPHAHTHTYTHTHLHTHLHTHTYTHLHTPTHTLTHTLSHLHTRTRTPSCEGNSLPSLPIFSTLFLDSD